MKKKQETKKKLKGLNGFLTYSQNKMTLTKPTGVMDEGESRFENLTVKINR